MKMYVNHVLSDKFNYEKDFCKKSQASPINTTTTTERI